MTKGLRSNRLLRYLFTLGLEWYFPTKATQRFPLELTINFEGHVACVASVSVSGDVFWSCENWGESRNNHRGGEGFASPIFPSPLYLDMIHLVIHIQSKEAQERY